MKIKELIKQLEKIKDKDRDIQILVGNEDFDSMGCDKFELMHADDCDQCVEIFCFDEDCYEV